MSSKGEENVLKSPTMLEIINGAMSTLGSVQSELTRPLQSARRELLDEMEGQKIVQGIEKLKIEHEKLIALKNDVRGNLKAMDQAIFAIDIYIRIIEIGIVERYNLASQAKSETEGQNDKDPDSSDKDVSKELDSSIQKM